MATAIHVLKTSRGIVTSHTVEYPCRYDDCPDSATHHVQADWTTLTWTSVKTKKGGTPTYCKEHSEVQASKYYNGIYHNTRNANLTLKYNLTKKRRR